MEIRVVANDRATVVHLSGHIDFESLYPFRKMFLQDFPHNEIIFNLKNLNFVGSSGITHFMQALKDISHKNNTILRLYGVGGEFRRFFDSLKLPEVEVIEEENNICRSTHN